LGWVGPKSPLGRDHLPGLGWAAKFRLGGGGKKKARAGEGGALLYSRGNGLELCGAVVCGAQKSGVQGWVVRSDFGAAPSFRAKTPIVAGDG